MQKKRELEAANPGSGEQPLTPQQLQRLAEYEMQKKLQTEYQAVQIVDESLRVKGNAVPMSPPPSAK